MKPPQVNEVKSKQEPKLAYKVVFEASKFQRSLARRLVTQLSRCQTLHLNINIVTGVYCDFESKTPCIHTEYTCLLVLLLLFY